MLVDLLVAKTLTERDKAKNVKLPMQINTTCLNFFIMLFQLVNCKLYGRNQEKLMFLKKLMKSNPMPVVMVSAYTEVGSEAAIRSLELGAVDVVEKPRYEVREGLSNLSELIIDKVNLRSLE